MLNVNPSFGEETSSCGESKCFLMKYPICTTTVRPARGSRGCHISLRTVLGDNTAEPLAVGATSVPKL